MAGYILVPDPANRGIYDELFTDYKNVYASLDKAYKRANGERFRKEH